ncbi:MAG TPA: polysaccharide biosynthesis C-terminal domain-containing protein [Candidatus Limnocylindrales bacterium]|nr:polysaccharide biosynthesis C-terminal domain-containing protein [Candidatus Limnocylindrales bacterium]
MSLGARVGRAIFWSQAGRMVEAAILFLFSLLLARVLGPSSYGLYALGMSLAGVLGFVTLLGLGPETLGRFLPELAADGRGGRPARLLRALLVIRGAAIVSAACLIFPFRTIILARFHFPLILECTAAVLLVFAGRSVLDLLTYFSSGLLELRRVALAKVAAAAVAPALFVGFLISGHAGATAAWASVAAGSLAGIVILGAPLLAERSAPFDHQQVPIRRILAFGLFAWATNFFVYILGDSTDVLLLGWLLPDRAAIGHYAVGARIVFSITGLLLGWAALVSVASFSESYQKGGPAGLARSVEAQWKLGILCVAGPFLLLLRYARAIITTLYSTEYAASVPVIWVLCGFMGCAALLGFSLGTSALYAIGRERVACLLVAGAALFNIVVEVVLVRRMGIVGAAVATGLSFVVLAIASDVVSRASVPWRFPVAFGGKVVAAAAAALVPTLWVRSDSVFLVAAGSVAWSIAFVLGLSILKPLHQPESVALGRLSPRLARLAEFFAPRNLGVAAGGAE